MDLTNALQSLMALFVEHISTLSADITSVLKSKVTEWIASQAGFIQALLGSICRESLVNLFKVSFVTVQIDFLPSLKQMVILFC